MFVLAGAGVLARASQGVRPETVQHRWGERFEAIPVPRSDHEAQ